MHDEIGAHNYSFFYHISVILPKNYNGPHFSIPPSLEISGFETVLKLEQTKITILSIQLNLGEYSINQSLYSLQVSLYHADTEVQE